MEAELTAEPNVEPPVSEVPEGLKGKELIEWAHGAGEACVEVLKRPENRIPRQYLRHRTERAGLKWHEGFFEASIDELVNLH